MPSPSTSSPFSSSPSSPSALNGDAYLEQGLYFALTSFFSIDCKIAGRIGPNTHDSWKRMMLIALITYANAPFIFVPFTPPEKYHKVYEGAFRLLPFVVTFIFVTFAAQSFLCVSSIAALTFQLFGALMQLLRFLEIFDNWATSIARIFLAIAISLNIRVGIRYINEESNGGVSMWTQIRLRIFAQASVVAVAMFVNSQFFANQKVWAAISFVLICATTALLYVNWRDAQRQDGHLDICMKIENSFCAIGNCMKCCCCCGSCCSMQSCRNGCSILPKFEEAWTKICELKKRCMLVITIALPDIALVIMNGCTDTMLLIVISRRAGVPVGFIRDHAKDITVIAQISIVIFSELMRAAFRSMLKDTRMLVLRCSQFFMFFLLLVMTAFLMDDAHKEKLLKMNGGPPANLLSTGRIVTVVLVMVNQAFVSLPATIETIRDDINETTAEMCRQTLWAWRLLVVYSFSHLCKWIGRPCSFATLFLFPFVAGFTISCIFKANTEDNEEGDHPIPPEEDARNDDIRSATMPGTDNVQMQLIC